VSDALDDGPFFHGTKADLRVGDLLTAGFRSNYRPEVVMNHVYQVEPTGDWENDPNVTDKKFPGNPTRSYRSTAPLRVVREVEDWPRLTPEALATWRERLAVLAADERGAIIN
jgi:rifampin ADP-ribosylating transferase